MVGFDENNFDEIFREKLMTYEETPPAGVYDGLVEHFSYKPELFSRRIFTGKYLYIAASVLVAGILAVSIYFQGKDKTVKTIPQQVNNSILKSKTINLPVNDRGITTNNNISKTAITKTTHSISDISKNNNKENNTTVNTININSILKIDTSVCGLSCSLDKILKDKNIKGRWSCNSTGIKFISKGSVKPDEDPMATIRSERFGRYSLKWMSEDRQQVLLEINFIPLPERIKSADMITCGNEFRFNFKDRNTTGSWNTQAEVRYEDQNTVNTKVICNTKGKVQFIWTNNSTVCATRDTVYVSFGNSFLDDIQVIFKVTPSSCHRNNGSITANVSGGNESLFYCWSPSTGSKNTSNIINNLYSGEYHLKITTGTNCEKIFDVFVPDSGKVVADFNHSELEQTISTPIYFSNLTMVDGEVLSSGTTYKWSFGDGTFSEEINPEHSYSRLGDFKVKLLAKSKSGCVDSVVISDINISPVNPEAPNVFSPNGDGLNDFFKPKVKPSIEFTCTVMNQEGKTVFEWNDPNAAGWDGKINNSPASEGTYYYVVKGTGELDGKKYVHKGYIVLKR